MATVSTVSKPGYIYDANTDTWYPIGVGSHTHSDAIPASANVFAGKNAIINGAFNVNQRAFTSVTVSGNYCFDRWFLLTGGTTGTSTLTPQTFTPGAAPVAGYEGTTFLQSITAAGASTDTFSAVGQKIENVRTLAGQTATVSFYAKATSGTPKVAVEIVQNFGSGGSPSSAVQTPAGSVTISTSWTRYSVTIAIPSISGKTIGTTANDSFLATNLWLSGGTDYAVRSSSIGLQNNTFQIWGVQVEAGSTATPFQTASGSIGGELALCQRYYWRSTGGSVYAPYGTALAPTTTAMQIAIVFPVPMRVNPTSVDSSTLQANDGNSVLALSAVALSNASTIGTSLSATVTGATQFRVYQVGNNNSLSGYLGFSAEL